MLSGWADQHILLVCTSAGNFCSTGTNDFVIAPTAGNQQRNRLYGKNVTFFVLLPVISFRCVMITVLLLSTAGCGTTQLRSGTEQLLLSDAVDRSIDRIDLSAFDGESVFLDSTFITPDKSDNSTGADNYVNSSYIISALRQKLITTGCLLKPAANEADYVIEARVGALGTDILEVTYGIPASNTLGAAANLLAAIPAAPTIPEISIGKRNSSMSTSKVVLFAYHRETGRPVWQSGAAVAQSDARDLWLFGAGPFQRGSIHGETRFAGTRLQFPWTSPNKTETAGLEIGNPHQFIVPRTLKQRLEQQAADAAKAERETPVIVPASHEQPAAE